MGKKKHSYEEMASKRTERRATYGDAFAYDRTVRTTGVREVHASVNPAHGGKRHIAEGELVTVVFDVTGSYASVPRKVQADLPELFSRLVLNKWLPGKLNLQFGAVGDMEGHTPGSINGDTAPFQLSQAEPDGATADEWLSKLYLEGGGYGQGFESYDLAFWALANQNKFDGWKEGKKGSLFVIFDEQIRSKVLVSSLRELYTRSSNVTLNSDESMSDKMMRSSLDAGDDSVVLPTEDLDVADVIADLRTKYDVWCIMIKGTNYWNNEAHLNQWRSYFNPERVIQLEDADNISELISGLLGAKYAAVAHSTIVSELKSSVKGSVDMKLIEAAMTAVPQLPASADVSFSTDKVLPEGKTSELASSTGDSGAKRL